VRAVKAGGLYFGVVFGVGFVLGTLRLGLLVPRTGDRAAELMETPLMLVAIALAARWVVRRLPPPRSPAARLGVGGVALGLLLVAEGGIVLWLRGITIADYIASRDPVSGAVYLAMLAIFALAPLLVVRP
jgi:hypothetical protein